MFPELHPGVRILLPALVETKRSPIGSRGQHGAGGEIRPDAQHLIRIRFCRAQHLGNGPFHRLQVIPWILERGLGR